MVLIIDAGNTNIKFGMIDSGKILELVICKKDDIANVDLKIFKDKNISIAYIGSVIPSFNEKIASKVKNDIGIDVVIIKAIDFTRKMKLSRFNLETQGVDILALALYVKNKYNNGIGICFGTATFAVIISNGTLHGTIICPSIETGLFDLKNKTEMVETNKFKVDRKNNEIELIGHDTSSALKAGAFHTAAGIIGSIQKYAKEKFELDQTFVTGGKTYFLPRHNSYQIIDNLILLGYEELIK